MRFLQVQGVPTIQQVALAFAIGDTVNFSSLVMLVTNVAAGAITAWSVQSPDISSGSVPTNPFNQISTSGAGTKRTNPRVWGVGQVVVTGAGAGFDRPQALSSLLALLLRLHILAQRRMAFLPVPGFVQQRLFLWRAPWRSTDFLPFPSPGLISTSIYPKPTRADDSPGDACLGTLNNIKAVIPSNSGMLVPQIKASWVCQWWHSWRSL